MVYLNHAGTSWPKPAPVLQAADRALRADPADWPALFEPTRAEVAAHLGVPEGARLLLTPGCTSALAVAIADQSWEAGDRVLCSAFEHHALHRQLLLLERRGVRLEAVPQGGAGEPLDLGALERRLKSERVRLLALTAACNVTGERLPVAEALELARAHGVRTLVDAAQVAGWMTLDQAAPGADLIAFAGHKGPQAPWGIGGLVAGPAVELASPGATCELPPPGSKQVCAPLPGYCDVGSVDRVALAGLAAGLRWLAEPEQADRLERAQGRVARLTAGLLELPGVRLHGPPEAARRLPTVAITLAGRDPAELARALAALGIQTSAGLQCAPLAHRALGTGGRGVLRLSAGPATAEEEIDAALDAFRRAVGR